MAFLSAEEQIKHYNKAHLRNLHAMARKELVYKGTLIIDYGGDFLFDKAGDFVPADSLPLPVTIANMNLGSDLEFALGGRANSSSF